MGRGRRQTRDKDWWSGTEWAGLGSTLQMPFPGAPAELGLTRGGSRNLYPTNSNTGFRFGCKPDLRRGLQVCNGKRRG